jgi:predicted metallopeptidase
VLWAHHTLNATISSRTLKSNLKSATAGFDADILVKVVSSVDCASRPAGVIAAATAKYLDLTTLRPIYAEILICKLNQAHFEHDLETVTHELLHSLVRPHLRAKSTASVQDCTKPFDAV